VPRDRGGQVVVAIRRSLNVIMFILWPSYMRSGNAHSPRLVLQCWARQKILRRNAKVPWPVHPSSLIRAPSRIDRGSRTPGLAVGCYIDGRNGIVLGDNVWIGPYVRIISMNHDVSNYDCYVTTDAIHIERNSWIGAGATILPSVRLGQHTVVGAGAVVTKSFPEGNQVLAGNPARVVKKLTPYGV